MIFYLICSIFFNFLFLIFFKKIETAINLYDFSNNERKIHQGKIACFGGLFIYFNLILISLYGLLSQGEDFFPKEQFFRTRDFFTFFGVSFFIMLLGIYDDKYNLTPYKKLLFTFFIFLIAILVDDSLIIKYLEIPTIKQGIFVYDFSILFTIFCFLLFSNAFNMFDGVNTQSVIYSITLLSYLIFKNILPFICLFLIVSLIFFLILNFQNRIFLGKNGTFLLSFILSILIIKGYNGQRDIWADEILLLMLIPGLELIRLFVTRIASGKSAFEGDKNHIHHILISKFGLLKSQVVIHSIIIFPILIDIFLIRTPYALLLGIFLYLGLIISIKK